MKKSFLNETPFYHNAKPSLFCFAKENRKKSTAAEKILWQNLKARNLSRYKFRRQHPFDDIIIDFYCHELKLAIEVDGGYHFNDSSVQERDFERDKKLALLGIKTLRFSNTQVIKELQTVLSTIKKNLPSPVGEGPGERS